MPLDQVEVLELEVEEVEEEKRVNAKQKDLM